VVLPEAVVCDVVRTAFHELCGSATNAATPLAPSVVPAVSAAASGLATHVAPFCLGGQLSGPPTSAMANGDEEGQLN
jgi:hypothetical protein